MHLFFCLKCQLARIDLIESRFIHSFVLFISSNVSVSHFQRSINTLLQLNSKRWQHRQCPQLITAIVKGARGLKGREGLHCAKGFVNDCISKLYITHCGNFEQKLYPFLDLHLTTALALSPLLLLRWQLLRSQLSPDRSKNVFINHFHSKIPSTEPFFSSVPNLNSVLASHS